MSAVCSVRRGRWLALGVSARIALIQIASTRIMLDAVIHGREILVSCHEGCGASAGETCRESEVRDAR
jgi:hypothetical protein